MNSSLLSHLILPRNFPMVLLRIIDVTIITFNTPFLLLSFFLFICFLFIFSHLPDLESIHITIILSSNQVINGKADVPCFPALAH